MDYLIGTTAAVAYITFMGTYLRIRPKGAISVMDMFILMFCLQFGPHSIIVHPFLEDRELAASVYSSYAAGLAIAFIGLALGLGIVGTLAKTNTIRLYPVQGRDLTRKGAVAVLIVGILYIAFFVAFQGFDLSRTINYLNFFQGNSIYSYTELRREMYEDDAGLGLSAVTRQTSSALIYCSLIYVGINFKKWRYAAFSIAAILFVVCCMQMNKFPFLYYSLITTLVVASDKAYRTGRFVNGATVYKAFLTAIALILSLSLLYWLQYRSEIESGIVTSDRLLFRVISRPFAVNHGSLYYWFDVFPDRYDFIGFANIPSLASALNLRSFAPTVEVPSLYINVKTTFQAGYIGAGYASFGYAGIFAFSLFVGGWVSVLTAYEKRINAKWLRIAYFSVIGINMYFLASRELHTALQSGGFVLAPFMVFCYRSLVDLLKTQRISK